MSRTRSNFKLENSWLTFTRHQPQLRPQPALEVLARAAELPGNLRYAIDGRDSVYLIGEVRVGGSGSFSLPESRRRLQRLAEDPADLSDDLPDEEELACVIASLEMEASCEEGQWRLGSAITLRAVNGGVLVEQELAEASAPTLEEGVRRRALARLLCQVAGHLRFVKTEITAQGTRFRSLASGDRLEEELPDSLTAVQAAARVLGPPVRALLQSEELARAIVTE